MASALAAAAIVCAFSGAAQAENATLYVNYSSACTFTITNDSGASVTSIAPGSYNVDVVTPVAFGAAYQAGSGQGGPLDDCAGMVQFQLTGPGVSISTTLDDGMEDSVLFAATFKPSSSYTAVDENQPSVATTTFTTTASGSPTAPPAPTDAAAAGTETTSDSNGSPSASASSSTAKVAPFTFQGTLEGTVSAAGRLTLTFKGKKVASLTQGKYTVTVVDKSKTAGFIIQQMNELGTTVSGPGAVGKHSVTISMYAGQWFYYPSFVGSKSYFLVTR